MKSKALFWLLTTILLTTALPAQAQQQTKVTKIGELIFRGRPGLGPGREVFRRTLRELGYVEGKNITFESRSAEGKADRFPALADELVRLRVDVLVASSTTEALVFRNATMTIPIVFIISSDPVAGGLVDSMARPGGNITGIISFDSVLAGKRLEILKESIPNLCRVAVLWSPQDRGSTQQRNESQLAARELGLQLHSMEVSSADKLEGAFTEAVRTPGAALAVTQYPLSAFNRKRIVELVTKYRQPAIYSRSDYVSSGGLMSYGRDESEPYRRVASMVDKILKGAQPANLPVEQPKKFEFVINLKTAKQIGLTIPPNVLARADRVIR